ncbi:glycoside hydrolase family 31 protein [Natronoflexus pectinivorans]|uniref:Alpha-D-xyloside xylohydrolase n=1 Tax=Natronoflexus pectinivorans TaxID=682526 RepID=A0A4V2RWT2_9BACT|nr:TIM-barrel domain-containing protein [Natronoflexus pectinivorans]TCO09881.1 alpha-D-xyloside xylohydrolase [Natronoflexus pectinivorans]
MKKSNWRVFKMKTLVVLAIALLSVPVYAQMQGMQLLNEPQELTPDFRSFRNTYFVADRLADFDPQTASGKIVYERYNYETRQAFSNMLGVLAPAEPNEFPAGEYEVSPALPFSMEFISPRAVRIRAQSGVVVPQVAAQKSLMLINNDMPPCKNWVYSKVEEGHKYTSPYGSVVITEQPWRVTVYDENGRILTSTNNYEDNTSTYTPVLPFSWVRRARDYSRSFNAAFNLQPGEKIFGFGEQYTEFNKRGQSVTLWVNDANGTQNETSYKPIPFFLSSRGYGMFIHTSTPITADIGKYFSGVNALMIGDEELDLFVFIGEPKDILNEYTNVTGKPTMPPLWSFGFWMSRITYFSEAEGREAARQLRENRIPADVINFDTGWFEVDWRCDYQFAESRFDDAEKMISDLKADGFHTCLWQLPYFVPKNRLFQEIVEQGLFVRNAKGNIPYEDAVLDFTNPTAIKWYEDKIRGLLEMGVGSIKVDFGEAAPVYGIYHNGRTGWYEHNLYPLRYNKIVAELTQEIKGENIIWARSTWAGSQRYPLHWGGDPAPTNSAMKATLRGGLSMGLSGFTFWSHDVGGFVDPTPADVYKRWLAFGVLSSHTRAHGHPPKEPWEYGEEFLNDYRDAVNMRYKLMPYIYAQSKHGVENGLPMMRALFIEYPDDPGAWLVDDQYLFGSDMLVAPHFENLEARDVYLPGNHKWIDYQTGKIYNPGWNRIETAHIPAAILVRDGAVIPHIGLAQATKYMDWSNIELKVFSADETTARGKVCLPSDDFLKEVVINKRDGKAELVSNPFGRRTKLNVSVFDVK